MDTRYHGILRLSSLFVKTREIFIFKTGEKREINAFLGLYIYRGVERTKDYYAQHDTTRRDMRGDFFEPPLAIYTRYARIYGSYRDYNPQGL